MGSQGCGNGSSSSYYLAAQHQVDALAIMTISDSLVNPDEDTTAEERQNTFTDMMKVGLETLIAEWNVKENPDFKLNQDFS